MFVYLMSPTTILQKKRTDGHAYTILGYITKYS